MLDLQEQQLIQEISSEEKKLDEKIERRKAAILQLEAVRKATSAPKRQSYVLPPYLPTAAMLDSVPGRGDVPLLPPGNVLNFLGNISSLLGPSTSHIQGHQSQPQQQQQQQSQAIIVLSFCIFSFTQQSRRPV